MTDTDKNTKTTTNQNETNKSNGTTSKKTEERRKIGRWYLGETLGKGGYSWVKKGYDRKTNKAVALKFMDRKYSKKTSWNEKQLLQVKTEIEALKQMKHPNIMRLLAYNLHTSYPDENGNKREVILLVLEYMAGGELFDILYYTSKLEEVVARTYFRQLMAGIEACHNACIVHRDIKPQNLLLDKHFTLKLCDFGLAKLIESDSDAIMETYHVGTRGYQAPEVLIKQPYTSSCDIFSAGVVLFILLSGYPPFEHAKKEDNWYGHIAKKEYKYFWKSHKGCGISPPAMDLITRMLHYSPEKRISLPQIKQHDWYNGKVLSPRELTKVLRLRHTQMQLKRQQDPIKQEILQVSERKRSLKDCLREEGVSFLKSAPELPNGDSIGLLDVFTTKCGYEVLDYFDAVVKHHKGDTEFDHENFQLTIRIGTQVVDKNTSRNNMVRIIVRIYHYKDYGCNVVKFHRASGGLILFRSVLTFLQRACNCVLTGVPELTMKSLKLTDKEHQYLGQYFVDSDKKEKDDNNNDNDDDDDDDDDEEEEQQNNQQNNSNDNNNNNSNNNDNDNNNNNNDKE